MMQSSSPLRLLAFRIFLTLAGLCGFLTLAAAVAPPSADPPWQTPDEVYDPAFAHLRSVDEVVALVRQRRPGAPLADQVYELEQVLRARFYHGYSHYGLRENWLAWLSGRVVHPHLSALVDPDEILQHQAAACSQQAIVVQAALQRLGVRYASVELPSHFQAAAWLDGQWFVVDPWGPLDRDRTQLHTLEEWQSVAGRERLLRSAEARQRLQPLAFEVPRLVKIDTFPAPRAQLFHRLTGWASDWLWLPLALLALALRPAGGPLRRGVRRGFGKAVWSR